MPHVVNVHNPHGVAVSYIVGVVRSTLVTGGLPPTFATVSLDSGKSTVIDCSSIAIRLGLVPPNLLGQVPPTLFEGFVTIKGIIKPLVVPLPK